MTARTASGGETPTLRATRRRHRTGLAVLPATLPLVLGHAGAGATWQALLVVLSLGMAAVLLLAVAGRVRIERPDDLVLPLAGVAIASSLAPLGSELLSDWVGWAFPVGVVVLATLVAAAVTSRSLSARSPLTWTGVAVAAVAGAALYTPLTLAWHPPPEFLPMAEDIEVAITTPDDGAQVPAGSTTVEVSVSGGSIAEGFVDIEELGPDPQEGGVLVVAVDGTTVEPDYEQTCTRRDACTSVRFPVELEAGERRLSVEFRRADGASFTPLVTDRVELTIE